MWWNDFRKCRSEELVGFLFTLSAFNNTQTTHDLIIEMH